MSKAIEIISTTKIPDGTTGFRLQIRYKITGTDGSPFHKVFFSGLYGSGTNTNPIFSDSGRGQTIAASNPGPHEATIPFAGSIPNGKPVEIWGMLDTVYVPPTVY